MKITSGIASGINLLSPKNSDTRPALERARISLFSSLGLIEGARIADLFAGSGAFGLESASRGASDVLFVDKNFEACSIISKNIEIIRKSGVEANLRVIRSDIFSFLRHRQDLPFNFIFLDPPYSDTKSITKQLLDNEDFAKFAINSMIILKVPDRFDVSFIYKSKFGILTGQRRYGGTDFISMKIQRSA
ncbi:MAG TPA: RsmD family RNA methyltransferase [Victivallales bacterium]|nr:RsmD family RNA methyltransferase [Victivallales bacterium]